MSYSTYVISLKDEHLRRSEISRQLDYLGQEFTFLDAKDLREATEQFISTYYNLSNESNVKRPLTKGEVGCALSHIECYRQFINSESEWAWIIEDDAILSEIKKKYISEIINMADVTNCDTVILGYSKLLKGDSTLFNIMEPVKKICSTGDIYIGTPWRNWTCGTVSYLINQAGAKKLLEKFDICGIQTVADDWSFFQKELGLTIYHSRPLLVFENFYQFNSSIEKDRALVSKKELKFLNSIRVLRGLYRLAFMKVFK